MSQDRLIYEGKRVTCQFKSTLWGNGEWGTPNVPRSRTVPSPPPPPYQYCSSTNRRSEMPSLLRNPSTALTT
jgi:hypothetical protein